MKLSNIFGGVSPDQGEFWDQAEVGRQTLPIMPPLAMKTYPLTVVGQTSDSIQQTLNSFRLKIKVVSLKPPVYPEKASNNRYPQTRKVK